MSKPRDVTLLILDEDNTKTIKVRRFLVEKFNFIIITSLLFVIFLVLALFFFIYNFSYTQFIANENNKLVIKNYELTQQIATLNDSIEKELGTRINELDKANVLVDSIRKYLKNRGVSIDNNLSKLAKIDNSGMIKASYKKIKNSNYNTQQIEFLYDTLSKVPLGIPYKGLITSQFGYRIHPVTGKRNSFHNGVDIAGSIGNPVSATASGVVTFAGTQSGYGKVIYIQNGYNYSTVYGHLSRINVTVNQKIKAGDIIGNIGNTGRTTGPHLHYEIRKNNEPISPNSYLSLGN